MTVTLNLKPEIEAGLLAQARATGVSLENYLQQLVEKQLSSDPSEAKPSAESGMVWENGLFVYRTGKSLPSHVVDDVISYSREERTLHILGEHS